MRTPRNRNVSTRSAIGLLPTAFLAVALLNPLPIWAQGAKPDAATLSKYDTNKNGVLDANEVAAMQADQAKAGQIPVSTTAAASSSEIVTLNPFSVDASKDIGYYAENTLAGSRLKTNVGDLASSITVVTKQQLEDTGALNINDVFLYEANTEGAGTYTPLVVNRGEAADTLGGYDSSGGVTNANTANRIRGLGAADTAQNNYPTLARIPFDSYNTQSVEINRGPNSMLFGSGGASGIVNNSTAEAALNVKSTQVSTRFDNYGSYRVSLNTNVPLGRKVALYVAGLYDDTEYARKPSSNITRRQYAALTFQPWSSTKITADFEHFNNKAHTPNFVAPLDEISNWLSSGRPGWDPVAQTITFANGTVTGPFLNSTQDPRFTPALAAQGYTANGSAAYTTSSSAFYIPSFTPETHNTFLIDNGKLVGAWFSSGGSGANTNGSAPIPAAASRTLQQWIAQNEVMMITTQATATPPAPSTGATGYTTFYERGITNRALYDYTKYNVAGSNYGETGNKTFHLELNQRLGNHLNLQLGWFRQEATEWDHYGVGSGNQLERVQVDPNTKLMDGTPNPYFGHPYTYDYQMITRYAPEKNNSLRALLAYDYDFTKREGWTRYLGKHRLVGLASKQTDWVDNYSFNLSYDGGDPRFLPNQNPPIKNNFTFSGSNNLERHYYVGDGSNGAITKGSQPVGEPSFGGPGKVSMGYYDWNSTNTWQKTTMSIGSNLAGGSPQNNIITSTSFAYQGSLWSDRIIPLLGTRYDKVRIWTRATGIATADRFTNGFANNIQQFGYFDPSPLDAGGDTTTLGGVVRPFGNWKWIDARVERGSRLWDFVRGLAFNYNHSENFTAPTTVQTDFFGARLPKPSGGGSDYGVRGSMFNNKLSWSLNWYKSTAEHASIVPIAVGRAARIDNSSLYAWATQVVRIRDGQNPSDQFFNNNTTTPLTTAEQIAINKLTEGPNSFLNAYDVNEGGVVQKSWNSGIIAATNDLKSKGMEASIIYNPTRNWNIKVTGGQQYSSYSNASSEITKWLYGAGDTTNPSPGSRLNYWQNLSAPDLPTVYTLNSGSKLYLGSFWNGYGFTADAGSNAAGATSTPRSTYYGIVDSQLYSLITLQNQRTPSQREYSANIISNYAFSEGRLKGWTVGGSMRWSSNAVSGYYSNMDPATFTHPTTTQNLIAYPDLTKPQTTPALFNMDAWVSYSTRLPMFGKSVKAKFQLNVRSLTESGGLTAILYESDGSPAQYRINDPRTFFLTSTFTF